MPKKKSYPNHKSSSDIGKPKWVCIFPMFELMQYDFFLQYFMTRRSYMHRREWPNKNNEPNVQYSYK